MSKHTPGPWKAHGDSPAHSDTDFSIETGAFEVIAYVVSEADVNLIAAAPELKDALQNLVLLYEADEGCRQMPEYIGAIAALKKATSISN